MYFLCIYIYIYIFRDDAHSKLTSIMGKNRNEVDLYNCELIELKRKLIHVQKFRDFVGQKFESRNEIKLKNQEVDRLKSK